MCFALLTTAAHAGPFPSTCTSPSGMTFVLVELANGPPTYVLNHELSVRDAGPLLRRFGRARTHPPHLTLIGSEWWDRAMTSDDAPVSAVTYRQAVWLSNRLSKRDRLRPAMRVTRPGFIRLRQRPSAGYRFLTTTEWLDLVGVLSTGSGERCESNVADSSLAEVLTVNDGHATLPCTDGYPFTAPVWTGPAPMGIYGLFGNVSELTLGAQLSQYGSVYYEALGFSWQDSPAWAENNFRTAITPTTREASVGIRLALDPLLAGGFACHESAGP